VIQQNAGAAEEMSSTAEELASQAQQLQATISFFKVEGNGSSRISVRQARHLPASHAVRIAHMGSKSKTVDGVKLHHAGVMLNMEHEAKAKGDHHDIHFEKF
jgi:methyl-accepting chemotaxis protein